MEVSVTTLPWLRNVRVKRFASKDAIRDAIVASFCRVLSRCSPFIKQY